MKKLYTIIPAGKPEEVKLSISNSLGKEKVCNTAFPILTVIETECEPGERVEVIPVISESGLQSEGYTAFCEELKAVAEKNQVEYKLTPVDRASLPVKDKSMCLYLGLTGTTADNDRIYSCISYGSKELAIIVTMMMKYACLIKENVKAEKIMCLNKDGPEPVLDDLTSLFYIDSSIVHLSNLKYKNPEKLLESVLDI